MVGSLTPGEDHLNPENHAGIVTTSGAKWSPASRGDGVASLAMTVSSNRRGASRSGYICQDSTFVLK